MSDGYNGLLFDRIIDIYQMCAASGLGVSHSVRYNIYIHLRNASLLMRPFIRGQSKDISARGPPTLIPVPLFLHLGPAHGTQSMAKCL